MGLVMLYSSSMVMLDKHHLPVDASMLKNQLVWFAVALLACVVLASLDYAVLRKLVWPVFIGSLLLAALVFVPHIGQMRNGAHRWIGAGGKTFQPSELVKIAIIIAVAWYAERSHRKMHTFVRGAVVPCLIIGFALGLIYVEPDRGTCFLMAIVTGTMLTMVGVRWHHLICLALIGGCLVAATSKHDTMRSNRIKAWWNPKADKTGVSSQGEEAKKAFGHGGLTGVGLGNGLQKNGYVAEIHSDFIFANIGEELGLVATLSVVAAFFMITLCGFEIARQARDQFGWR